MMNTIYLLRDPRTNEPRYVGVTSRALDVRMRQHRNNARGGIRLPVLDWHRKLIGLGLSPVVEVLEITEDRSREAVWIAQFRATTSRLLNLAPGGNQAPSSDPAVAAKIAAAHRARKGKWTDEHRRNLSAARLGRRHTEEARAKMRKPKTAAHRDAARLGLNAVRAEGKFRVLLGDLNPSRLHPERLHRGERNACSKLTEADVIELRKMYADGASTVALGRHFGISHKTARHIAVGIAWAHVPGAGAARGRGRRKPDVAQISTTVDRGFVTAGSFP